MAGIGILMYHQVDRVALMTMHRANEAKPEGQAMRRADIDGTARWKAASQRIERMRN
ncbi:MAG TPA: hypothetical protein VIR56_01420 [Solimonas sp.]